MKIRHLMLALVVSALSQTIAHAQTSTGNWPARPIKLIVPTGPGAGTDVIARVMATELSKAIGGSMYVENMPGASGLPAHQAAATADPDGYTLLFSNTSGLAINPTTFKKLPYDPEKSFTMIALVADFAPQIVSVNKSVPVQNLAELIKYVKANPGKVSYGVDATAGAGVFTGRLLNRRAGLDMAEVPYRNAAQLVQDAATGRVEVLVSSIIAAQPFVQTGDLHQIAVSSGKRFPGLPDLATIAETVPGAVLDGWFVLAAPKGTPQPIVDRLNKAVKDFLGGADIQQRLIALGLATNGTDTPEKTAAFIQQEQQTWQKLAKEIDIQQQ